MSESTLREAIVVASIENNFTYHKPFGNQQEKYERIRALGKELAYEFFVDCPDSRELSLALTKLEESIMWANASIARNEKEEVTDEPTS